MFRDKHEVFRDKQHYQYMTKLTVYTSNITINKYSFEAPNRDKHDSHEDEAAPPGTKVQTTQAPTSTMHHGTSLHAKAHKAIRQGCKLTMTMIILPSKM